MTTCMIREILQIAHIHETIDIEYLKSENWLILLKKHGSVDRGSGGQNPPEAEAFWLIK